MTYVIYKYTFPNNKVYIGQTKKGTNRINNKSAYKGQLVYNAMNKYKTWDTEILLECPETLADWWETSMIKIHDSMNREKGYNRESGGNKNKHYSLETRKKMSESKKGKIPFNIDKLHSSIKGSDNGRSRDVNLIDTINGDTETFPYIKAICEKYPEWNYKSVHSAASKKSLFKKRYKIEYIEEANK